MPFEKNNYDLIPPVIDITRHTGDDLTGDDLLERCDLTQSVAYFKTPKCAGQALEATLRQMGLITTEVVTYNSFNDKAFGIVDPAMSARLSMTGSASWLLPTYTWSVVRNPYARTVSAMLDMQKRGYLRKDISLTDWLKFLHLIYSERYFSRIPKFCDCPQSLPYEDPRCDCFFPIYNHAAPWQRTHLFMLNAPPVQPTAYPTYKCQNLPEMRDDITLYPRHMSKIIRYENLQEGFDEVCDAVGWPQTTILVRNRQPHSDTDYTQYYSDTDIYLATELYWYEIDAFNYKFGE